MVILSRNLVQEENSFPSMKLKIFQDCLSVLSKMLMAIILHVSLIWPGRNVKIRVWEAMVGKVRLILLDTDSEDNSPEDRTVTHYLYGGDNENRLRQELILGIGGIRALEAMGLQT